MVFIACLLGVQHKRDSVENKLASFFVVYFGKTLNGIPPLCGRQVATRTESTRVVLWRLVKIDPNSQTCHTMP